MPAPPYMKLYVADYLGDTTHLSTTEHGAYLLLLMAMWRAGGKLPADDAKLAKIAQRAPKEWASIRETVLAFFQRRGGRLTHKRLSKEIAKYEHTSAQRSEAGKRGGIEKANKTNRKAGDFASRLPSYPEPEPESSLEASKKASKSTRRERPEARHEGASDLRVIEGGWDEGSLWAKALDDAQRDLSHFELTDPDFASEIAEFIAVATTKLGLEDAA